jgi:hypothetical protein
MCVLFRLLSLRISFDNDYEYHLILIDWLIITVVVVVVVVFNIDNRILNTFKDMKKKKRKQIEANDKEKMHFIHMNVNCQ